MNNLVERKEIERICNYYVDHEVTDAEKIKALDKKVHRPAQIMALTGGVISSLIFGTGMCLAMKVIGATLHPAIGIAVGVVGMGLCGLNYLIYKSVIKRRKKKYAEQIVSLCDRALNGKGE